MPKQALLYRKRLIPSECILLDKDEIILHEPSVLVTKWKTIRPKKDLDHGISCYLPDKGWKVSRFLDHKDELICWYCDIIDSSYHSDTDTYIFTDLLADVILYPSGAVHVVDLDEIADALEQGLLLPEQVCSCMRKLDSLLKEVYSGRLLPSLEKYWPVEA
ncbi:MAG: DUF402 domain-containing protein [Lachnospiraceae bacterium]|jgi:predicted RNA-binding protein associated with RNAse of E/G family|nr:DUF402 domain-containing protein [Lachnospiraceae bacterium]